MEYIFNILGLFNKQEDLKMKFHERLLEIRKKQGLISRRIRRGITSIKTNHLQVGSGQSYPDFQRLVMLSDYFNMTLDELVKGIDVQDVREKNRTDEKVTAIYLDLENGKARAEKSVHLRRYAALVLVLLVLPHS